MKIRAFVAEIFAKQYWCFLIINFQCIFYISANMQLRNLQSWIITEWLWNFFETRSQNGPISMKWKHQSQLIFCISRLSHKHITFNTLRWTPCNFVILEKYLSRILVGLETFSVQKKNAWVMKILRSHGLGPFNATPRPSKKKNF